MRMVGELTDTFKLVDKYILDRWQNSWDVCSTGQHYKTVEPFVSRNVKYTSTKRRKEITITRLRLGKCRLNMYLKEISAHADGLCENCRRLHQKQLNIFCYTAVIKSQFHYATHVVN